MKQARWQPKRKLPFCARSGVTGEVRAGLVGHALLGRFFNAIKADENEGEDSELLEAMGYVSKSRRKSGLHRVSPESNTTPIPKAA